MIKKRLMEWFSPLSRRTDLSELEKETLKRLKSKGEETLESRDRKPSKYVGISNKLFSNYSMRLMQKKMFKNLPKDLVKANLEFLPKAYVSVIIFTTLLSIFVAIFLFIFFLFFNIGAKLPIITLSETSILIRSLKTFWILFAIPVITFLFMYSYPSLEKGASFRF